MLFVVQQETLGYTQKLISNNRGFLIYITDSRRGFAGRRQDGLCSMITLSRSSITYDVLLWDQFGIGDVVFYDTCDGETKLSEDSLHFYIFEEDGRLNLFMLFGFIVRPTLSSFSLAPITATDLGAKNESKEDRSVRRISCA